MLPAIRNCGLSVGAALYVTACGREKVIFAYKCGSTHAGGERGQIFMRQKMRHTLRSAKESVAKDGADSSPVRYLGANTRCGNTQMLHSFQFTLQGENIKKKSKVTRTFLVISECGNIKVMHNIYVL